MATILFGDAAAKVAPARGVLRRSLARMIAAREQQARRSVQAHLLGLDDARFAAFGYNRKSIERAGDGGFPL